MGWRYLDRLICVRRVQITVIVRRRKGAMSVRGTPGGLLCRITRATRPVYAVPTPLKTLKGSVNADSLTLLESIPQQVQKSANALNPMS